MTIRATRTFRVVILRAPDDGSASGGASEMPSMSSRIDAAMGLLGGADPVEQDGGAAPQPAQEAPEAAADGVTVDADAPANDPAGTTQEQPEQTVTLPDGTQAKLSEVLAGYQRQADYTRKTQELAEQRKAAEARQAEYQRRLDEIAKIPAGDPEFAALARRTPEEWQELARTNPAQWTADFAAYGAGTERQRAAQQKAQEEQQRAHAEHMRIEGERLAEKLPEWKDEAKRSALARDLASYLQGEGFDQQQIAGISDHRTILVVRKAMMFDRQQRAAAAAREKQTTAQPTPTVRPVPAAGGNQTQHQQLVERARKTGRMDDRVAAVAAMLQ